VTGHRRTRDERREPAEHRLEHGRPEKIVVTDAGETRDHAIQVHARIDEAAEARSHRDGAVLFDADADRADLDDAVQLRVEPGGLEVEGDELQSDAVLAAALPRNEY
jgi:acyl-coenzyme A synthetase/AMP-(fatty) acid ligase